MELAMKVRLSIINSEGVRHKQSLVLTWEVVTTLMVEISAWCLHVKLALTLWPADTLRTNTWLSASCQSCDRTPTPRHHHHPPPPHHLRPWTGLLHLKEILNLAILVLLKNKREMDGGLQLHCFCFNNFLFHKTSRVIYYQPQSF